MNKKEQMMAKVMEFSAKIQNNVYLDAISKGLMGTLPIMMIGSIALLIAVLPFDAWKTLLTDIGVRTYLMAASTLTTSCMSIYSAYLIGHRLATSFNENGVTAGILSIFAFFIVTPLNEGALNMTYMGAQGLFTAMIASLLATRIYCALMKNEKIQIKMPDSVPPVIANTFAGLFPSIFVGALFILIAVLFSFTSWGSMADMIYAVLAAPLQQLGGSVWSLIILVFVQMILWFFGLHGSLVIQSVVTAVYLPMDTMNMEMVLAGAANSDLNILGKTFYSLFSGIGGAGGTLSLVILLVLIAKSKKHKALGKLGLIPGLFTINEPIVFGMPLILNPIMAIPFISVPLIQTGLAYLATISGLVPRLNGVQVPFGTPMLFNAFLAGGWRAAVLQLVLVLVGVAVYYPFFKMLDKQAVKEEAESEN